MFSQDEAGGGGRGGKDDDSGKKSAAQPGKWIEKNEAMSTEAAGYQDQIAGNHPGFVYEVNGVTFDGYDEHRGVLVDAKSSYAPFIKDGEFVP